MLQISSFKGQNLRTTKKEIWVRPDFKQCFHGAPNVHKFQTKIPSGLDFVALKTVRATTYFCPHGSPCAFWKIFGGP